MPLAWPATTPCASHTRRLNEKNRSFSSARGLLRARGGHLRSLGGGAHGWSTRDGCSCCSRVLRLYGARESELPQPKLLPTADLLVLLVYIGGKRGTSLAQMLDWRSLFPTIRRLTACVNTGVVLARAVSATPPSIAIVALVLGGPECVRALC